MWRITKSKQRATNNQDIDTETKPHMNSGSPKGQTEQEKNAMFATKYIAGPEEKLTPEKWDKRLHKKKRAEK